MSYGRFRKYFPLVVPSWVVHQVNRAGAPLTVLFDLPRLMQICSMEDVATVLNLNTDQNNITKIFGEGLPVGELAAYWCRWHPQQYQQVLELQELHRNVPEERLFLAPSEGASGEKPRMIPLEAPNASEGAILIVLKPGQLGGPDQREVQQSVVRGYIEQLYVFTDFAELAGDALFGRFLKSLASDTVSEPV